MTTPKINNHTVTDTKDSKEEERSDKELKNMIIRMINEMKVDIYKKMNEFQGDTDNNKGN
jgi:hypothetical protein